MADLPYTWTDEANDTLTITARPGPRIITNTAVATDDDQGVTEHAASVVAPTGPDAVALARAVLDAAGDTGHIVVDAQGQADHVFLEREEAAASMRERALGVIQPRWDLQPQAQHEAAEAIAALPLLADAAESAEPCQSSTADPDTPDVTVWCEHPDGDGHTGDHYADGAGLTWTSPALCAAPCPHGHDHACARSPQHCGPHRDVKQKGTESCSWLVAEPDVVHVATPEGITPCGEGHHDVTTTALIREATCLDCLRTLAQAAHGDVLDEDPDIGLAERVAHLEATRADEAHGLATTLRGIVDGALKRIGALEAEVGPELWSDLAAPGGYVCAAPDPSGERDICGLPVESEPCREHSLPGRLAATEGRVTDLEEALEEATKLMAAYQEDLIDLQRRVPPKKSSEPLAGLDLLERAGWKPGVEDDTDAGDCPTCGREPADQETGPDGQCRHTPATRLGRP